MKTSDIFISDESIAIDFVRKYEYPYMALTDIKDYIIELGGTLGPDYVKIKDNVWIHKTAKVAESANINGPAIIDENAEIRTGAFIRGSVIIGKNSVFGNSCEAKNSIIFNNVQTPHFNYIGDSILGFHAHMGAGSVTSNVKADHSLVKIKSGDTVLLTERKKVGAFIGDYAEIGCNSVLNPGTVIGHNTIIYPLTSVRGTIPSDSIVKNMDTIVKKINKKPTLNV